jgi:phosphoribosylamine--glycine ligase
LKSDLNILVVGSGGREHALVWKLSQSPRVRTMWCAPGNPGISSLARCMPIGATEKESLADFALRENIDLTVVGPEQPLADGIVDFFRMKNLKIFGPSREAAALEWSKAFAKDFMSRHGIPTASYRVFSSSDAHEASGYVGSCQLPVVIKADGLAAGKGVVICATHQEAQRAVSVALKRGGTGEEDAKVVIEDCMQGEEASVFAVTNGKTYVLLQPAQDHKRLLEGDRGKNTGGMGAYAPALCVTQPIMDRVRAEIIEPTIAGMAAEGKPYSGCLYVGLMITGQGPKVVEYNCRFGDPETQVVLPLYDGDFADLLLSCCDRELNPRMQLQVPDRSAVCVVLASAGYPDAYESGKIISGLEAAMQRKDTVVFHAGTRKLADGSYATAGGRVLGVTSVRASKSFAETIAAAYAAVADISFEGMQYRRDIAARAQPTSRNMS